MSNTTISRDTTAARKAMIDSQLRTSGINAPFALERMGAVAREEFVPEALRSVAYMDRAIKLGNGRALAAPAFYGRLLEEAIPEASDDVLIVEGGTSYLAELVKPLAGKVDTISPDDAIKATSKRGKYSLLLIDGAIEQLPDSLAKRLADDARVVTGVVSRGVTRIAIGRKTTSGVALVPLAEMGIPVLPEFAAPKGWSF